MFLVFPMRQDLKTLFAVAEGTLRRGKFVFFSICIKQVPVIKLNLSPKLEDVKT